MPDSFAHKINADNGRTLANYVPRCEEAFILGSNGSDPFFFHSTQRIFKKSLLPKLGHRMHREKTGLFLQNLFKLAQTEVQKDYCLGFLCHYAMDSVMHPYIEYITSTYGLPFAIANGHGFFESALDSKLSFEKNNTYAAHPDEYFPYIEKMYLTQIITLLKRAIETTYPEVSFPHHTYMQSFKDFKKVKSWLYSETGTSSVIVKSVEGILGASTGLFSCHCQPCMLPIEDVKIWERQAVNVFCSSTIKELMEISDQMSADYIKIGNLYFSGIYSSCEFLEDIGNKSYITGVSVN